jgi:hypothetical protein
MPLTIDEFNTATSYNSNLLLKQSNNFCASQYYMIDTSMNLIMPETHSYTVFRKSDDIIAAAVVGVLAIMAPHGDDAIKLNPMTLNFDPVELKLAIRSKSDFGILENGLSCNSYKPPGLYSGDLICNDKNKRTNLRSAISAGYKIQHNLKSKNMETFFVIMDADTREVVTVRSITGDKILEFLTVCNNTGVIKKSSNRFIKLIKFMNDGKSVDTMIPQLGLEVWENQIRRKSGWKY